jgi:hypothetical protein
MANKKKLEERAARQQASQERAMERYRNARHGGPVRKPKAPAAQPPAPDGEAPR